MTDWRESERKQMIQALNRIADHLGRIANGTKIKGRWKWQKVTIQGEETHAWICSQCGSMPVGVVGTLRYCPWCGSRNLPIEGEKE